MLISQMNCFLMRVSADPCENEFTKPNQNSPQCAVAGQLATSLCPVTAVQALTYRVVAGVYNRGVLQ
jgi:hypothetical protein